MSIGNRQKFIINNPYSSNNSNIYRDLKPENLLLGYNDEIKLADFGYAYRYGDEDEDFKEAGTLDYLCPEMISNSKYDKKIDNWCLGELFFLVKIKLHLFIYLNRSSNLRVISW